MLGFDNQVRDGRGAAPPFPSIAPQQWSQIVWIDIFRSQPNNGKKRWPPAGVIRRPLIKAYMRKH